MHRDDIALTSPCPLSKPAQSRAIQRDSAGGLWCSHCHATVHDLAELGPEAAQALVARGGVCVRAPLRRDGRVAWKTRRSGAVALRASLVVAAMASAPAVASLSKEPGEAVGLLDWMWTQVEDAFAEPVDLRPVCTYGLSDRIKSQILAQGYANTTREPDIVRDPIAIVPAKPYNPIGRRDPFGAPVSAIGGGIAHGGFPPALPSAATAPQMELVRAPSHPPPSEPPQASWPPGVPLNLHTLPPPRPASKDRIYERREGGEQLGEHQQHRSQQQYQHQRE